MHVYPQTDRLPGEPLRVRWSAAPFALRLLAHGVLLVLTGVLTAGLWPLFLLGIAVWGWPPHQPRPVEIRRVLRAAWTERPPPPGIPPLSRAWLILRVLLRVTLIPAHGLAWYLDELLYGRQLSDTPVVAPLIVLSAARSGSTQIARYLEQDPRLAAPSMMMSMAPYLWVWPIAAALGRFVSPDVARGLLRRLTTEEFHQRHEGDPFLTDTLEILFYNLQLRMLAPMLGPRVMSEDFVVAASAPHNRRFWEEDFVGYLDRLGRKTLLFSGSDAGGQSKRLFVKGHFLDAADALARRYPDAHFLTVIRAPASRLHSVLNHLHGNPFDESLGAVPWSWLAACMEDAAVSYCQLEQRWFTRAEGPARTVVRFTDYVADLEGTMGAVYRSCMGDDTLPAHVPTEHAPRERKNYAVNRTLQQVGIDPDALTHRLHEYCAWCRNTPQ